MQVNTLQTAIERAERLHALTITQTLCELQRIDETRGLRDQAEIDYWAERLNNLCDSIEEVE